MSENTCKHCGNDTRPTILDVLRHTADDGDEAARLVLGNRYVTGHVASADDHSEGFYDVYEVQGRKRPRLIASRLTERGATQLLDEPWKEENADQS